MSTRKTIRCVNFLTESYNGDLERREHLGTVLLSDIQKICWITHDKDRDKDGNLLKPHTHAVIRVPNAMTISAFSKNFAIRERLIQPCKKGDEIEDLDNAFLYMIHGDERSKSLNKYQYSPMEIKGPWSNYARERIKKMQSPGFSAQKREAKESEDFLKILDYIDNSLYVSMSDLSRWAASSKLWSTFRRSSSIIRDVIKEHNSYLEKLAAEKDKEKWQEDLEARHEIESVYEAIGYRALRALDTQLAMINRPSMKLRHQISYIDELVEKSGGKKGGVNVALIKEMLRQDTDPYAEAK